MDSDPRFEAQLKLKRPPQFQRKINIGDRHKSLLKHKDFQLISAVDKRGRPQLLHPKEDFLCRPSHSDSISSADDKDEDEKKEENGNGNSEDEVDKVKALKNEKNFDKNLSDVVKKRLRNLKVDYARGESNLFSSSSSDDDSEEDNAEDEDDLDHAWGELDHDAERTEEASHRLAVCNMDWDRVTALDLMVALSSFVPMGGHIRSVTIYPSEFGLKRQREEEEVGPPELLDSAAECNDNENNEVNKLYMEKLRQYQLLRLKYYYAVVVCDNKETADKLYTECDGFEYELSSTKFDLRFIPDDMTFDREPKEVCEKLPAPGKYQPKFFTTSALQQAKCKLTWDETDPDRVALSNKLANKEDVDDDQLRKYLASSSDEEDNSTINKYKALLSSLDTGDDKISDEKEDDVDMEFVWDTSVQSKTEELSKLRKPEHKTPFQKYLEKRKEKRKQKREQAMMKQDDEDKIGHDFKNDIPSDIDMSNPYFAEEFDKPEFKLKKKLKNKNDKVLTKKEDSIQESQVEQLKLICSPDDNRQHWHLKDIAKTVNKLTEKKKNKRKLRERKLEDNINLEVDVTDSRFSAIFNNKLYHIDEVAPDFIDTKSIRNATREILKTHTATTKTNNLTDDSAINKDSCIQDLVKSLKQKTEAFLLHKNKKQKCTK